MIYRCGKYKHSTFIFLQEIIDGIVEKGPVFSHEEYVAALMLLHRSDPTSTEQLKKMYIEKLADTMKSVGVTV